MLKDENRQLENVQDGRNENTKSKVPYSKECVKGESNPWLVEIADLATTKVTTTPFTRY